MWRDLGAAAPTWSPTTSFETVCSRSSLTASEACCCADLCRASKTSLHCARSWAQQSKQEHKDMPDAVTMVEKSRQKPGGEVYHVLVEVQGRQPAWRDDIHVTPPSITCWRPSIGESRSDLFLRWGGLQHVLQDCGTV